ncbi:SOUL heme-binding protein [Gracilaria domingensis]|nr:SOUL heme-binding protein [Gracilaria domingensis]
MQGSSAFCRSHFLSSGRILDRPEKCTANPLRVAARASAKLPDVGLVPKEGKTGTCCVNLWPLPLFGNYNWFLNVYDRQLASSCGPLVINHDSNRDISISFQAAQQLSDPNESKSHMCFSGIVTGNINVPSALKKLGYEGTKYQLRLLEKGGAEPFFTRKNEIYILESKSESEEELYASDPWKDPAPTFSVAARLSTFEVRDILSGAGSEPRKPSALEYFAMNLFPIFPFNKYSCFVCVWRQSHGTCPVAIDKLGKGIRLSFFDPIELPAEVATRPKRTARFAVKCFKGAVTDTHVHEQHTSLLRAIKASGSCEAASERDFRILVDNSPGIFSSERNNELWVQLV